MITKIQFKQTNGAKYSISYNHTTAMETIAAIKTELHDLINNPIIINLEILGETYNCLDWKTIINKFLD